ncbi:MAG TPA: immunoglobulin domain-containing protein [Dongiaceae bacterium]|nr:immunoglobulin domain-containing protein [Dongiaceae bacterium]
MKRKDIPKKSLAVLSTSALAAGMAHGAITYHYYNTVAFAADSGSTPFDLDGDGHVDYLVKFSNNNVNKPFVDNSVADFNISAPFVLSDGSSGLPLTTNGTAIDASYLGSQSTGYFYHDGNDNLVGGWQSNGADVEGYVGLLFTDSSFTTHYGWAHFVYNSAGMYNGVPGTVRLIDSGMETAADTAILAGQKAETNTAPVIVIPPASQTATLGSAAQLQVIGVGDPEPTYQWMSGVAGTGVYTNVTDGGGISGSTSNVLTLNNLTLGNAGDYVVVLSNANGSVTNPVPATLTVNPIVISGISPSQVQLYSGTKMSLTVSYSSSMPVTFQWLANSNPLNDSGRISGTTNATLLVNNLTGADSGNYQVILSSTAGSVTSSIAPVVISAPASPYQQQVAIYKPVTYYPLNETGDPAGTNLVAFDYVGGLNGVYGYQVHNGNTNYNVAGPRPTDGFVGFAATNNSMLVGPTAHNVSSFVTVPAPNLNTNTVTITTWIYPQTSQANYNVIISYRGAAAGSANGLGYGPGSGTNSLGEMPSAPDLSFHWNDQGYSYNWDSFLIPPAGEWSLVALVVSPSNTVCYLANVSGGISAATNANANVAQAFSFPGHFGGDSVDNSFVGQLDDVAVFNKALSPTQVTNLFNAALTGTVTPENPTTVTLTLQQSGSDLILTWPQGTLLEAPAVTGPWATNSATSPYTLSPTAAQKYYRVLVQ